jgi:predicted nucleic acid-binding protein
LIRGRLATVAQRSAAGGPRLVVAYGFLKDACDLIRDFPIIGFDAPAEAAFRALKSTSPQSGTHDLRIAATALANNLVVVTSNARHFSWITGLTLEDWTV